MNAIKNIFYMLSYAFSYLKLGDVRQLNSESFQSAQNMFSEVLYMGISRQLKRGLEHSYHENKEVLSTIRGQIDFISTINGDTLKNGKIVCNFDEFNENTELNRIIKTTCMLLIRNCNVGSIQKNQLKKLMPYFKNVDEVQVQMIDWSIVRFNRNNSTYQLLINICYIVLHGLIQTNSDGSIKLLDFFDSEEMHRLYERFVFSYFKNEHSRLNVDAPTIKWNTDGGIADFLPIMKTDITLEYSGRILIIDTKYYSRAIQYNERYNKSTYISSNLYQIYAYVKNFDKSKSKSVSGMLLYGKIDNEYVPENSYSIDGSNISVRVLDLNSEWSLLKRKLDSIAQLMLD